MENSAEKVVQIEEEDEPLDSVETEGSGLDASTSSSSLFASTSEEWPSNSMNANLQGGTMPWAGLQGGAMPWAGLQGAIPWAGLQGGAMPWAGLQGAMPWAGLQGGAMPSAGLLGGAMPWAGLLGGAMPWAGLLGGVMPWAGLQGGATMPWAGLQGGASSSAGLHGGATSCVGLQGGATSSAGYIPPPVGYYPYFYDWRTAQELLLRNYAADSSYVNGCSSNTGNMNLKDSNVCQLAENGPKNGTGDGDCVSKDKDLTAFNSRDDLRSAPSSSGVAEHRSNKQIKVDSSKTSTYETGGCSNVIPSNTEPPESSRPKILSSSGFSNYFSRQSRMVMKESVQPGASAALAPVTIDQNKSKQGAASEVEASTSENRNCHCTNLHSDEVVKGINLREWLDSERSYISKVNKLRLFRQIVQKVDAAHAHGIFLVELWPSSFILYTGGVKYAGPLMDIKSLTIMNREDANKRGLEFEVFTNDSKKRKLDDGKATNISKDLAKCWMASDSAQLEKKWYSCPDGLNFKDPLPYNVYCLGLLLFEFLCRFESMEAHSAAMLDLRRLILPPSFLSENPEEAGFCFWLLHPKPSSRPTIREILQSELIHGSEDMCLSNDATSFADNVDDVESDVLLDFLVSLKEQKEDKASKLLEIINYLDEDIKEIERRSSLLKISATMDRDCDARQAPNLFDHQSAETPNNPLSRDTVLRDKFFKNITQLEDAYLSMRSQVQLTGMSDMDRADKDMLRNRERFSWVQTPQNLPTTEESADHVGSFFNGICKFARYSKLEVCGTLKNSNILNSNNVISSLSFDREEEYIATAGVSRKIKIFEFSSLLDDSVDVQYPVLEMSNSSKFSCICWNKYIKNYLASADYDGLVQMWDVSTGQVLIQHKEHQKRAWSVDFSQVDPIKFASGSDDCSMKTWSINERNSTCTIWNPANVCCVQFSAFSSHLLALGSADYKIYCYDLRHTKIPWCTLAGHGKAVSFVRFLDPETLISSSTDNTLKLWDLKKTSLEGLSSKACSLTYSGHANDKHFVGMAALDGYIASGSETNEVYAYYRSLPMPITSHKFECIDPISEQETSGGDEQFVSSVCWRKKSEMLVAANSGGNIEILRMV